MGAGQFIKDFCRAFKIKKAAAHQHAVMQRKRHTKNKTKGVFRLHRSKMHLLVKKKTSHARLLGFLSQFKEGFVSVYNNQELIMVMYGLQCTGTPKLGQGEDG